MAPRVGFEPTTPRLTAAYSTVELSRIIYSRRLPTLPGTGVPSTIGVEELNFCVRDGNRCGLFAKTTGKLYIFFSSLFSENHTTH